MGQSEEEMLEELWEALLDLSGDLIALESFCRQTSHYPEKLPLSIRDLYLQRIEDYIDQHLWDVRSLSRCLLQGVQGAEHPAGRGDPGAPFPRQPPHFR